MLSETACKVSGFKNVFAIGNAVTGRGNIRDSKSHGNIMTNKIIAQHLQNDDFLEEWLLNYNENVKNKVQEQIVEIDDEIKSKKIMTDAVIQGILDKTKEFQQRVGYSDYVSWIQSKTPIRLEDMLNN